MGVKFKRVESLTNSINVPQIDLVLAIELVIVVEQAEMFDNDASVNTLSANT